MSKATTLILDNGKEWAVLSHGIPRWLELGTRAQVCIPIEQLQGMTPRQIGEAVLECVPFAAELLREELAEMEASLRNYDKEKTISARTKTPGHIYLIHGEGTKWYKIGKSKHPDIRAKQLGTQGPFKYNVLKTFPVYDMDEVETYLHEFYADKRVEGEWFTLHDTDVIGLRNLRGGHLGEISADLESYYCTPF